MAQSSTILLKTDTNHYKIFNINECKSCYKTKYYKAKAVVQTVSNGHTQIIGLNEIMIFLMINKD